MVKDGYGYGMDQGLTPTCLFLTNKWLWFDSCGRHDSHPPLFPNSVLYDPSGGGVRLCIALFVRVPLIDPGCQRVGPPMVKQRENSCGWSPPPTLFTEQKIKTKQNTRVSIFLGLLSRWTKLLEVLCMWQY